MTPIDPLVDAIAEAVARRLLSGTNAPVVDQRLLNIKSAAKYLCRTESSIRGMISGGEIPRGIVRRFSGRLFLEKKELDRWIDAQ